MGEGKNTLSPPPIEFICILFIRQCLSIPHIIFQWLCNISQKQRGNRQNPHHKTFKCVWNEICETQRIPKSTVPLRFRRICRPPLSELHRCFSNPNPNKWHGRLRGAAFPERTISLLLDKRHDPPWALYTCRNEELKLLSTSPPTYS